MNMRRILKLKDCCTIIAGQSPESKYYNTDGVGVPFFQGKADFGELYPTVRVYCSQPTKIAEKDDILLSVRAPVGPTNLSPGRVCIGRGLTAIRPSSNINLRYLLYYFRFFEAQLSAKGTGTTFKAITQATVKNLDVPVPSLSEQERIVSRIEELFSQLDASVAELKTAKERLKVYRQAVLKEALDGIQDVCETTTIQSVCKDIKVGIVIRPTQYYVDSDGVRAFRNANVRRGFVEDNDWAMISKDGHEKNRRSEVHTGDVLIARSGVNLGMAAAVPEKFDGYNAIDVVIAVPKQEYVLSKYLAYYTNSPHGMNSVKANQRGVAQGHLNVKVYGKLPLMLPALEYQEKVVSKIEEQVSVCDGIEKTGDIALQQAEALRQSILKKAFEGKLM